MNIQTDVFKRIAEVLKVEDITILEYKASVEEAGIVTIKVYVNLDRQDSNSDQ